ncbi:hypothetical protein HPB50_022020 [Hyalomma asiaticum]|uniref:Uncharacterized protein n=1 Tax=Hyalomma asiaticum TaxID=266040 RepID=A0ACB7SY65_HYAAI|nr:hypothetical protein HPB50_022020 [Hyalomma asiaticum]
MDLLQIYVSSTVIKQDDSLYLERDGFCIGSRITPILIDLLLARYDRKLQEGIRLFGVVRTFRHVDDFLPLFRTTPEMPSDKIFAHFSTCSPGFSFTKKLPTNGQLRFVDLQLCFGAVHTCWQYAPRSEKGLIPFTSHHSKLVKCAIALSAMKNA